jgi:Protein of unknown function (DUF3455)
MRKPLFGGSVLPLYIAGGASALGLFLACDDAASDNPDGGNNASAGESSSGARTNGGAKANGGAEARAGADASAGTRASGGDYGNGGTYGTAGKAPIDEGGAPGAGGASAEGGSGDSAGAGGEAPCVPEPPTPPTDVPALVAAPAGVTLLRHFHAVGTQNYRCKLVPGNQGADPTYSWVFTGPVANMLNSCGKVVGTHFAAPNTEPPAPEWQYDVDGSSVVGIKVNASPVAGAIPELLLKDLSHGGNGVFTGVTYVQRLRTAGGAMPAAASCDLAHIEEDQNVGYTAEYYFYSGGN